jgi:hypothetical protein
MVALTVDLAVNPKLHDRQYVSEPGGIRTHDHGIKSPVHCH